MVSTTRIVAVLLLLSFSIKSVMSKKCIAYCKGTQIKCLKASHKTNWDISWGKELAKAAQKAATNEVNGVDPLIVVMRSEEEVEYLDYEDKVRIRHVVPDFAMRTEICRHYMQTYRATISKRFRGGKVGCGVDWSDTFIVVHCNYKN